MAVACHKVFVYGTLKKNQPNEYFMGMMEGTEFMGLAETCLKYPLIIGGHWNLPMLLDKPGQGKIVSGELYLVGNKSLKQLDEFEGHPEFYERKEIQVNVKDVSKDSKVTTCVRCWTYFINEFSEEDLQRKHFSQYDSAGSHGMKYDTSENDEHPGNT